MAFRKFIVIVFIAICPIFSCSKGVSEFHVALMALPERINPADTDLNYALYIIKQLFEPIFKHSNTANSSSSDILSLWESYNNSSDYKFCIKDNITFSNGRLLNAKILKENIEYFESKNYLKVHIASMVELDDKCLSIKFEKPYPLLFLDLMSYKTAIVDPETRNDNVLVGISPYHLADIFSGMIHLKSDKPIRFKEIYFHKWKYGDNKPLYGYDDINPIPERYFPEDIDKYFNGYEIKLLKTLVVLINHNDPQVRNYLFNCIDYSKIRQILYPNKTAFTNVGGLLPLGLSGALDGEVNQNCPTTPLNRIVKISFPTYFVDAVSELQSFLNKSLSHLNINVEVTPVEVNDLAKILLSDRKKYYDATIVAFDAPYPASVFFFNYFIPGEGKVTNIENIELRNILERHYETTDENEAARLMEMANRSLVNNHQILPLFQMNKHLYFSKKVGHITSDQLFIGIPNISEL